ncbi:unnamed protein product [Medioppia subpectinata]|uniref:NR LBD domain-containing protein n=1 Tax=Medioppia subpectinata TaxID=1979941 RepID=A0A7R9KS18_9ACAR|nr:unnamed protein product [Medioppia subpectinata]CAG2108760.1 unnamed protein product [Medioppia subpectinata]
MESVPFVAIVLLVTILKYYRVHHCYAMGMKKDWIIMNEYKKGIKQNTTKKQPKAQHKQITQSKPDIPYRADDNPYTTLYTENISQVYHYSGDTSPTDTSLFDFTDSQSPPIDYTIGMYLSPDGYYSNSVTPIDIPDTFDDIPVDNNVEQEIDTGIMDISSAVIELGVLASPARPLTDYRNQFNELEGNKLQQLLAATNTFVDSGGRAYTTSLSSILGMSHRPNLLQRHMRRLTKMCQNLTEFNNICESDKIALMSYGSIDLFCMRSLPNYDYTHESWTFVMDKENSIIISLNVLQNMPRDTYELCKQFFKSVSQEWDSDSVILDLLTAIIFFNPHRPNLKHKHMVKLHQHIYMHLLKRYLLLRYRTDTVAQMKYASLMKSLINFRVLGQNGGTRKGRQRSVSITEDPEQSVLDRPALSLYSLVLNKIFEFQ